MREDLITQGRCFGIDKRTSMIRADELIETFGLVQPLILLALFGPRLTSVPA